MNSWNQPNDNEPSVGMLHHLALNNTTTTTLVNGTIGTGWSSAIDCSSFIPIGSKAILLRAHLIANAAATGAMVFSVSFSDNNSNTPSYITAHPFAYVSFTIASGNSQISTVSEVVVPLTSARTFYYYRVDYTNCTSNTGVFSVLGYYL